MNGLGAGFKDCNWVYIFDYGIRVFWINFRTSAAYMVSLLIKDSMYINSSALSINAKFSARDSRVLVSATLGGVRYRFLIRFMLSSNGFSFLLIVFSY